MITLSMTEQIDFAIGMMPNRQRVMTFTDQRSGIMVTIPIDPLQAALIGRELQNIGQVDGENGDRPGGAHPLLP